MQRHFEKSFPRKVPKNQDSRVRRLRNIERAARRRKTAELERDPEKWKPVFRKDHAQSKR
jgi:hypothetical protein